MSLAEVFMVTMALLALWLGGLLMLTGMAGDSCLVWILGAIGFASGLFLAVYSLGFS